MQFHPVKEEASDNATASQILSINRKFTKLMACYFQFSFIKVTP